MSSVPARLGRRAARATAKPGSCPPTWAPRASAVRRATRAFVLPRPRRLQGCAVAWGTPDV
eukprot:3414788-Pyramimonas_sp.AAC.1